MLDLTKKLVDSKGKMVPTFDMSLADMLCLQIDTANREEIPGEDLSRFWNISKKIGENGNVLLDEDESKKIFDFLTRNKRMPLFVSAQLLEAITDYRLKLLAEKASPKKTEQA